MSSTGEVVTKATGVFFTSEQGAFEVDFADVTALDGLRVGFDETHGHEADDLGTGAAVGLGRDLGEGDGGGTGSGSGTH